MISRKQTVLVILGIFLFLLPLNIYAAEKKIYKDVKVSWYAKGLKNPSKFTYACWSQFPKGTKFKVTYNSKSVTVVCDDRGSFSKMGRFLDLSSGAFKYLAPLSRGIIRAEVEIIK